VYKNISGLGDEMSKQLLGVTVLCGLSLMLIPGCADYKAVPLRRLGSQISRDSENPCVSFDYLIFNKIDCKKYLGRDVIAKGFQPVQITFTNNSDKSFIINPSNFSLPCVDPYEVAKKVHYSVVNRVVGYGVGALFIWPLAIPAVIEGINAPKANQQLDEDYDHKIVQSQVLKPFSIVNGLIFVPKDSFNPEFTFTLVGKQDNKSLEFSPEKTEYLYRVRIRDHISVSG